jgi:hypothetical protein
VKNTTALLAVWLLACGVAAAGADRTVRGFIQDCLTP